jgi:hypothetical protein
MSRLKVDERMLLRREVSVCVEEVERASEVLTFDQQWAVKAAARAPIEVNRLLKSRFHCRTVDTCYGYRPQDWRAIRLHG